MGALGGSQLTSKHCVVSLHELEIKLMLLRRFGMPFEDVELSHSIHITYIEPIISCHLLAHHLRQFKVPQEHQRHLVHYADIPKPPYWIQISTIVLIKLFVTLVMQPNMVWQSGILSELRIAIFVPYGRISQKLASVRSSG